MTSVTAPMHSNVPMMAVPRAKLNLEFTDRCNKLLVYQGSHLLTHNCLLSATNLLLLGTTLLLRMARRVQAGSPKAWHSMSIPKQLRTANFGTNSSSYPQSPYGQNPQMYQQPH